MKVAQAKCDHQALIHIILQISHINELLNELGPETEIEEDAEAEEEDWEDLDDEEENGDNEMNE